MDLLPFAQVIGVEDRLDAHMVAVRNPADGLTSFYDVGNLCCRVGRARRKTRKSAQTGSEHMAKRRHPGEP